MTSPAPASGQKERVRGRIAVLYGLAYDPDVRLRRETQTLSEAGYDVRILAWDRARGRPATDRDGDVRIERIHVRSRYGRGLTQIVPLSRSILAFAKHLRAEQTDIVHAVDLPMLCVATILRPVTARRALLVYDAYEIYSIMVSHRFPRWAIRVMSLLEQLLPRRADLVITPGRSRQAYFRERGVPSIVVPNWIDPPRHRIGRAAARDRLHVPHGALCIAYTGALLDSRDFEPLFWLAAQRPSVEVLIAGRGETSAAIEEASTKYPNVRYLGWLDDPSAVLDAADAMYYAIRSDHKYGEYAAPNNLYQAVAYGIPLVYRAQGELRDVGREFLIGIPFDTPQQLVAAVERLGDSAYVREIRGSLAALRTTYSWRAAAGTLLAAYPSVGSAASRPRPNGE